jgi:predicted DNA-binding transcriptional regulator AlpA
LTERALMSYSDVLPSRDRHLATTVGSASSNLLQKGFSMQSVEHRKLSAPEASQYLGISTSTLSKYRVFGGGPVFFKLGRRVVYSKYDLDEWVEARRRLSTSDGIVTGAGPR